MSPPALPEAPTPRLAAKMRTALAVIVLLGLTLTFYYGLWLPGLVLIKRDAYRFFLPLKQYLLERLSAGELPQWFPYEGLGRSFIGVTHTGVFHPFTALYFLFSVPDAYRVSTLLSCLLAALGTFGLGRLLGLSRAGALLAGLAFALSGYVVSLTDNLTYLYSICALPLFCAALEQALRAARTWTVAPAAVWASVFLQGDVQTGYYYGFVALLWAALRAPASYREAALRLALAAGLAVLLAGVQLGPAWAVFASSDRARPAKFQDQAVIWSTHPLRLVTILASPVGEGRNLVSVTRYFFDDRSHLGLWAESLYLGVPVTGLALLGAWHRRELRVCVWLSGLALLLALGRYGGLYDLFYQIVPLWSAFRYPEKFMGVMCFALALLAGAGLDTLRAGKGPVPPWLAAAVICVGVGFLLRTDIASRWAAASFDAPPSIARGATDTAGVSFLYSAAAALGMWLILSGARRGHLREAVFLGILTTLITLDLSRVNLKAYHIAPVETVAFAPPLAQAVVAREGRLSPGHFRIVSLPEITGMLPPDVTLWLGYDGAASVERRQALDLEHNAQFHLESAHPYLVHDAVYSAALEQGIGPEAAARYNVAYYVGRRGRWTDPKFAQLLMAELPDYDLALVRNPVPAKPRAYLSRRPERAGSPIDPKMLFKRPDFLNGKVDVIETPDETLPDTVSGASAAIERYVPEEVRVRVETPQPAVLILLDAYDQGWTATLENGVALPILRANALVRAVLVPAGTHLVTFSYQTPLLKAGAAASLTGILLSVGLIARARRRRRPSEDHA